MPTYRQIQEDIRVRDGKLVKTCWIAHVKELNGLSPRPALNRKSNAIRANPCPDKVRDVIEVSMRRLGMLPPTAE